jgi:hypothetical protein
LENTPLSRIFGNINKNNMEKSIGKKSPSFEEVAIIEKITGGKIGIHEWWVVKGTEGSFTSRIKPSNEDDIISHGVLENSFMSQGGEYIGAFDRAEWYKKHKLKVYEPYPHGVAESYNEDGELEGYCGYTHRGAQIFKIGDRLFDKNYEPNKEDYTPEQWGSWVEEYNKGIDEAESEGDTWWAEDIRRDGISRYIPFKLKGKKTIENLNEAALAAKNLSNYLS